MVVTGLTRLSVGVVVGLGDAVAEAVVPKVETRRSTCTSTTALTSLRLGVVESIQSKVSASNRCSTASAASSASRSGSMRTGAGGALQLANDVPMASAIGVARNVRLLTDDMAGSIPRPGSVELNTWQGLIAPNSTAGAQSAVDWLLWSKHELGSAEYNQAYTTG